MRAGRGREEGGWMARMIPSGASRLGGRESFSDGKVWRDEVDV